MIYAGIDFSSRAIDLAGVTPDGDWCFAHIALPLAIKGLAGRGVERALREQLDSGFWDEVACCWVERPMFGSVQTTDTLAAVRGAILDAIPPRVVVDTIRPSVWRVEVGIPGNAKRHDAKLLAREWLARQLDEPLDTIGDDQADAACIAWTCFQQSQRAAA